MSNADYDRSIQKAGRSLEGAVECFEIGQEAMGRQYAGHAHSAAISALSSAEDNTSKWLAENIAQQAAELLKPAYMGKAV